MNTGYRLMRVSYESLTSLLRVSYESLTSLLRVSYESLTSLTSLMLGLQKILTEY